MLNQNACQLGVRYLDQLSQHRQIVAGPSVQVLLQQRHDRGAEQGKFNRRQVQSICLKCHHLTVWSQPHRALLDAVSWHAMWKIGEHQDKVLLQPPIQRLTCRHETFHAATIRE